MNEPAARRELERAYAILDELKLLANNTRYELGVEEHNIREAARHLGAFYLEMADAFQRGQIEKAEDEKKEKTGY